MLAVVFSRSLEPHPLHVEPNGSHPALGIDGAERQETITRIGRVVGWVRSVPEST